MPCAARPIAGRPAGSSIRTTRAGTKTATSSSWSGCQPGGSLSCGTLMDSPEVSYPRFASVGGFTMKNKTFCQFCGDELYIVDEFRFQLEMEDWSEKFSLPQE